MGNFHDDYEAESIALWAAIDALRKEISELKMRARLVKVEA